MKSLIKNKANKVKAKVAQCCAKISKDHCRLSRLKG